MINTTHFRIDLHDNFGGNIFPWRSPEVSQGGKTVAPWFDENQNLWEVDTIFSATNSKPCSSAINTNQVPKLLVLFFHLSLDSCLAGSDTRPLTVHKEYEIFPV